MQNQHDTFGTSVVETPAVAESTITSVRDSAPVTDMLLEANSVVYVTTEVTDRETVNHTDENNILPVLDLQSVNMVNQSDDNNFPALDLQSANVETVVAFAIEHLISHNIENPVEMLRYLQSVIVIGRKLDIDSTDDSIEGETNFINVDRQNVLETALDEIKTIDNPRLTLEVQFYDEVSLGIEHYIIYYPPPHSGEGDIGMVFVCPSVCACVHISCPVYNFSTPTRNFMKL
jgi:hypothetical protein